MAPDYPEPVHPTNREKHLYDTNLPAWYRMNNPHRVDIQRMTDEEIFQYYARLPRTQPTKRVV